MGATLRQNEAREIAMRQGEKFSKRETEGKATETRESSMMAGEFIRNTHLAEDLSSGSPRAGQWDHLYINS